jgi:TP901 family phage tail tape measure protein
MADVNANIGVHIDTSAALAELKNLQRQLANFHSSVSKSSAAAAMAQKGLQTNLLNAINATGKFRAQMGLVRTSTESFTHALETNKLSMREYFRFAGGSTKTFGRLFKQEFNTIGKVAEERVKKMQTQYIKMGRDASGAMKAIAITPNTLNMKEYSTQLAVAAQKQALLNQLLKQGSTNLLNFGKNTQWAGRQLMVGFTIPLAYFGTAAAKTFMDLEKQAIRFKRVYGDMFTTTDETNKALADIQQLAEEFTKYGVAVAKTMEMAANAAAMGKTGADLTAQVAQATRLAVLGGVEQTEALETTISVTNAFGVAAEDLASKINFLNAVENQTVVSIEDLTIAIPKAGPVVKQLGGDVEDLAFFLTAMKEGGINASEGANALKSGLASLINPTEKASKMLAGFGINIKAIVEGNAGNIKETVIDFAQALDTLDPLNRARAIEQLFGKFQFSRLSTLFQNVTKDGTQAARVLELAGASIEELAILSERELGVLEDAVGTDFRESVEKLKLAIAPIGKTFLEAVTPIVKVIGRLLDNFNNLGDGTKKFLVVATTLVGVIGPVLLMTFGLLANGVANIIKLFITMRSGFLRAGTNTNLLAQQTQYLNSEQLEAATVAASLNQAHTRLTQSFSAETTAVRLLRQAYIDATIAATNFARANPGMMMPGGRFTPKKFARGVTEVPGSGNKDTVASMLTPGEAVIPAPIAQDDRFKPLIAALVSGEIKQYKKGVTSAGDDYAHVGGMKNMDIDKLLQDPRISALEKQKLATYRQILISQGKPTIIPSYGSLAYSFDPALNKAMAKGGVPFSSFEAAWTSRGPDKWISSNIPASQASVVDSAILKQIKASGVTKVTDAMVDQAFKNLPPEIKSSSGYTQMSALHSQLGSYGIGRGLGSNPKTSEAILQEAKKKGYIKDYKVETRTTSKGTLGTKSIIITNLDGTQVNLGRGSKTNRQYISDTQDTRRKSGIITGQTSRAKSPALSVVGGGSSDVRQVAVGKNESILNKKTTSALRSGRSVFVPGMGRLGLIGADKGIPGGQTQAGVRNIPFSSASSMRVPESQMNRLIESLDKNTKVTDDGTQTTTKLTKEQKREVRAQRAQRVGMVAGPAAGALGMASMGAFMTGNTGMGMGLMGASAVASIAPMLTNPIGILVAVLATATAGLLLYTKMLKNAREEGMNLAKAMSMSASRVKGLSVLSGQVSASEIQAKKRQTVLNPLGEPQRKFGQNVLQSEEGKNILSDVERLVKQNFSTQQIGKILGTNLSQAVLQGAISTDQARSIASALGEQIGSYDIPLNVSAKITQLMGPNGENLKNNPLQVALAIKKESMKNVTEAFDIFQASKKNPLLGALKTPKEVGGLFSVSSIPFGDVIKQFFNQKKENAKLDAAGVQLGFEVIGQNQQLLDSINEQYDKN